MSTHFKEVLLTHMGNGEVVFRVPELSEATPIRLKFREHLPPRSKMHYLLGYKRTAYMEIFRRGFCQHGTISLTGRLQFSPEEKERPILVSVIQADGDIICKVDRTLFQGGRSAELISGYAQVRDRFLEGFQAALSAFRRMIIIGISVSVPIVAVIAYFVKR